jgi:diaminopimelate epimerase
MALWMRRRKKASKSNMSEFFFTKVHGLGNDFVLVDCLNGQLDDTDLPSLALRVCDRHFGIGADGLVRILPSETADYRMQIWNSDGSEAEMCGNATRCFAAYLFDRGMCGPRVSIETLSGIKVVDIRSDNGKAVEMTVNMQSPSLDAADIPVLGFTGPVVSEPLEVDGATYSITCVSVGNPHCVVFVDDVDAIDLERTGRAIETHPAFPTKINVEFAQMVGKGEVRVRVWERGAGMTLACGSGACATVVAATLNGMLDRHGIVHLPGGDLHIQWKSDDDVYMTGPAAEVFTGSFKY